MKRIGRCALILLLLINSGCAFITSRSSDAYQKIEALVAEQNFAQAQAILELVSESHPDYERLSALQKEAEKLALEYEQQVMREAWVLKEEGKWYQAQELYRLGLANLKQSEKIQSALETLNAKRQQRVADLELDLLVARGEWLAQHQVISDELVLLTANSWFSKSRYEERQKESLKVAQELAAHGAAAMELDEIKRAEQLLRLSQQLNASDVVAHNLKLVAEKQQAQQKRVQAQRKKVQQRKQRLEDKRLEFEQMVMIGSFKNALSKNRLNQATLIARQLQQRGRVSAEGSQLIEQLAQAVQTQIKKDLDLGVEYYGRGDYQQAIEAWQDVLELDPENQQAHEHIARAERILGNLQRLRKEKAE